MAATRTQVYFTDDQRAKLDEIAAARGVPMALVVREAVAQYLSDRRDTRAALDATFGTIPDLVTPPRSEWNRTTPGDSWGPDALKPPRRRR